MHFLDYKKIIYITSILVVALFIVGSLTYLIESNKKNNLDLKVEQGVVPEYVNITYTNVGFRPSSVTIKQDEVVFKNLAEYPITLKSDLDAFSQGVRLEEDEYYYYKFESAGEYQFEEQKSGLKIKIKIYDYEK